MPKLIDIPGVGEIEFPDEMDDASIASEAGRLSMEATAAGDKWSDLPGNILPSVGRLIGGAVSGVASLPGLALDLMDPRPIHNQTQMAVGKALSQPVETAKAIGSAVGDKYGSGAALKHSLITDPAGVAADASVLLGGAGAALRGAGAASKVGGLVKAGEMAGRAGQAVDPLRAIASTAAAGGQKFLRPTTPTLQNWGTSWMQSAMKVAKPVQDSNTFNVAQVAARDKIMPTVEGFQQAAGTAKKLRGQLNARAREAQRTGVQLDPTAIVKKLKRETRKVGEMEATPQPYQGALEKTGDQFWEAQSSPVLSPVEQTVDTGLLDEFGKPLTRTETAMKDTGQRQAEPISVSRSMRMTERLNKRVDHTKKNPMSMTPGETPNAEAQDALRGAIRAERERVLPGTDAINKKRGEQLAVMKQLQNYTLRREGNLDPIPARALLGGGMAAGLAVGGAPMGAVMGGTVVPWVVNSPKFKGDMAIKLFHGDKLLNRAGQAARTGATATTRTGVASDALRQALLDAMNKTTEQP